MAPAFLLLALPLLRTVAQSDEAWGGALSGDDECGASAAAGCGLNALQLRGEKGEAVQSHEALEAELLARSVNVTALAEEQTTVCQNVQPCASLCRCAPGGPPGSGWTQWVCNVKGQTIFCADNCNNCQFLR
mmetsp:Transcript_148740/g.414388  ORF Transcript_148740/g.414388 Transcript_148740/m.414388 type:complete len:132 (+) Transcript_148740:72-467(+)